ncbi:22K [turkey adenovirus 4]|uniref:22K n=1 Tax=turkey adenovirus 4 TaxID=1408257 RepID=U5NEJ4_9ADEN|nr:22K [Turkey aviadenovirus 4]AGX93313.1 22K [Turkey aviadenovirus 4]
MAQKMIDEKSRVSEGPPPPPEDESAVPFPMNPRYEPQEEPESDGESLGSQDSEEYLSTISEEEEEEEEANKENMSLPPPLPRKRRSASYLGTTLTRPAIKKSKPNEGVNFPTPRKRKPRGNYRSWVRHRVAICQALRDAVFDKRFAAEILKRVRGIFVPPSILGYYSRKLLNDDGCEEDE